MSIFRKTIVLVKFKSRKFKTIFQQFAKSLRNLIPQGSPKLNSLKFNYRSFRHNLKQTLSRNLTKQNLFFLTIIVVFGFYVGYLFFGHNSLMDLLNLQAKKEVLEMRTEILKQRNAKLHKKYFELLIIYNNK